MNELALFAGAGGGILGGHLLGWRTVAAVEIEEYPRAVLLQRQADGLLPRFPIWDDVCTFDGEPWKGKVDVISGGFPCQDISAAGKGAGITGERSGLWSEMARIIGEVRPRFALMENSPMLTSRGLGVVLGDLAAMGYDSRWCVLGADDAGAPHRRKRIWILAYANGINGRTGAGRKDGQEAIKGSELADPERDGLERGEPAGWAPTGMRRRSTFENSKSWWDIDPADLPDAESERWTEAGEHCERPEERSSGGGEVSDTEDERILFGEWRRADGERLGGIGSDRRDNTEKYEGREWRPTQPRLGRVAHGVAHRVDRLKAIGNGQVPAVAALAWEILTQDLY